jgi:molecular chaperone Hsp33
MQELDTLQRFMFEHASIRGEIIHLDDTLQTILAQHPYPLAVKKILAEAILSCILLTGSIQFEGEVNLQFQGDERLPLLLVQCNHLLQVRAFAKYEPNQTDLDYTQAFLSGQMALILNQYNQAQTYQSVVPIRSSAMAENLMYYFAQSEQITSRVWLVTNGKQAAGMLLQLMPGQDTLQREQFWEYAVHLGETITDDELLSLNNRTILHRLYHETELRLFTARNISFLCRCTMHKMQHVLSILGKEEIESLLKETGQISVNCDFCNQNYVFDPIDIMLLFRN